MRSDQSITGNAGDKDWILALVLDKLKEKGYHLRFRREVDCLYCIQLREWIMPVNFSVDEYYYFESILNPDGERLLYAISLAGGAKGFLIDTCNAYRDNISIEMVEKLKLNRINNRRSFKVGGGETRIPDKFNTALA